MSYNKELSVILWNGTPARTMFLMEAALLFMCLKMCSMSHLNEGLIVLNIYHKYILMHEDHRKWPSPLSITNIWSTKSPGMDIKSKKGTEEVYFKNNPQKFKTWFFPKVQIIVV